MRFCVALLVGLAACGGEGGGPVKPAPLGAGGAGGAGGADEGGAGGGEAPGFADVAWARRFGRDTSPGGVVAAAPDGGAFVAGRFFGEADFGEGPVRSLADNFDGFVARLGPGGELRAFWSFGDVGRDGVSGLCANPGGAVALVGQTEGTVDLGGGPVEGTFVTKLDPEGAHVFSRPLHASEGAVHGVRCAFEGEALWIAGTFYGKLGLDSFTLEAPGRQGAFVARLGPGGAVLFAEAFLPEAAAHGTEAGVFVEALTATPEGGLLLGGAYLGAVDFGGGALDPGPVDSYGQARTQGFVVRLSADGAHAASSSFGGRDEDSVTALSVAPDGGALVGLAGLGPLGLSVGDPGASRDDWADLFWLRLGADGEALAAGRFEVSPSDGSLDYAFRLPRVAGIAPAGAGGARFLADFGGRALLGGGELRAGGTRDAFFAELSAGGELVALRRLGGGGPDHALALLPGAGEGALVLLSVVGELDIGTGDLPSTGYFQAVVAKLDR